MKTFVMKHWKQIMYAFAGFAILVNLIMVITTPKTVIDDFYKFGPDYRADILDKAQNVEVETEETTDNLSEDLSDKAGISFDSARVIVIMTILIILLLFLQNVMDGGSAAAKKK